MIKFRGKALTRPGRWFEGDLLRDGSKVWIFPPDEEAAIDKHRVTPETIAMYTGLEDKNKKEIYGSIPINGKMSKGGDIVKGRDAFGEQSVTGIEYRDCGFPPLCFDELYWTELEIIGNQTDNPELLLDESEE